MDKEWKAETLVLIKKRYKSLSGELERKFERKMAYFSHIHLSCNDFVLNKSEFVSKKPHANILPRYTRYTVEYISDFIV